jgi:hypothetical protein
VNQPRRRISGKLGQSARGSIIISDDGSVWVLEHEERIDELFGKTVAAEGIAVGLDRLQTDWIGIAAEAAGER